MSHFIRLNLIWGIALFFSPPTALGTPPTEKNWPMFRGGPQLTGVAASSLPDKPVLLWKFNAGDSVGSSAAIDGGVVYVGCDSGTLFALNLSDGSVKWRSQTAAATQPSSSSQPDRPAIQSSPTVHDDLVFFGDMDGVMHGVAKADGKQRWTYKTGAEIVSSVNCLEDRALFGSYDGILYCVDAKSGKEIWKFETEGKVHATPGIYRAKDGDFAVIAGCDANMRLMNIKDGKQAAAVEIGGYCGASPPIVGSIAYVGTFSNQVVGVDLDKKSLRWTYENPDRQFPYLSSAAVSGQSVVLGGRDKLVHCLDGQTGKEIWKFQTQGRIDSSPVIVGNRVFVGSSDGNLYALALTSGKEVWRYEVGSPMSASPAIADGRLVIGTEDGAVLCFGSPEARK